MFKVTSKEIFKELFIWVRYAFICYLSNLLFFKQLNIGVSDTISYIWCFFQIFLGSWFTLTIFNKKSSILYRFNKEHMYLGVIANVGLLMAFFILMLYCYIMPYLYAFCPYIFTLC